MESIIEHTDKEEERSSRTRDRIERMRREKQRQMRRRRMIRKYLRLGVCFLGLVIIMLTSVAALGKKVQVSQTEAQQNMADRKPEGQALNSLQEESGEEQSTGSEEEGIQQAVPEPREETVAYTFETTSATMSADNEKIISSHVILVDESQGTITALRGERQRISPASMTKVLTVLVAAEQLTEEELDNTFTMTREITDYGYINDCSSVGFLEGERVTVRDLFYGTILHSGSDAAVGLATYAAGSHEAFVELMNKKLKDLGLSESAHFTNCVGVYDENHYCTVYDMAVIMKAALQNELCRTVLSTNNYTTKPTEEHPEGINISNWFLRRIEDKDTGGEVLCAKTGYVAQSQNCAVSYAVFPNGQSYICVSAGATSAWGCIYDHVAIYNQYVQS